MNYGYNKEKGMRVPIEYVCNDCDFVTFEQCEEQQHYADGHYLRSKMRLDLEEPDPHNTLSNKGLERNKN